MLAQQEIDRREEVKDLKDCELFNASRTEFALVKTPCSVQTVETCSKLRQRTFEGCHIYISLKIQCKCALHIVPVLNLLDPVASHGRKLSKRVLR